MKVLLLFGSPRLDGYTNKLVELLYNNFFDCEEIEYKRINLVKNNNINHCIGCNKCDLEPFDCIFDDDMQKIYKLIESSDCIVLATPIYFNSVTSIMKTMIDRCQRFFNMKVNNNKSFGKKTGIVLATAGSVDDESFEAINNISRYFFLAINTKNYEKIYINNTDKLDKSDIYSKVKFEKIEKLLSNSNKNI